MAIIVYNPKYFKTGDKIIENKAPIKGFVWSHARWDLKVNEMKKFPDDVGEALLRHAEFLVRVKPCNLKEIKKQMEEKQYKCKVCEFETADRIELMNHVRREHKGGEEENKVDLDGIPEASPEGQYWGAAKKPGITPQDIENQSGINSGGGFYGPGYEKDTLTNMKTNIPGRTSGHFGG